MRAPEEVITVRVKCPFWSNLSAPYDLDGCPGWHVVEYHEYPPLFRLLSSTCAHPQERFFNPYAIYGAVADTIYVMRYPDAPGERGRSGEIVSIYLRQE